MNRFALIGASYKTAGVEKLGQLALPKDQVGGRLADFAKALGVSELAYIGTCNRIEFIVADASLVVNDCRDRIGALLNGRKETPDHAETRKTFRAWTGDGAVEHLFLVAAGLDSAQAGEREIYAQVRGAWQAARSAGTAGPQLDYVFDAALKAAQDVHQEIARPANADSLANFAVRRVRAFLGEANDAATVALVGVSPMTRHCARVLAERGMPLLIVNRTLDTADDLAREIGAVSVKTMTLDAFRSNPSPVSAVITAVGGGAVLDRTSVAALADRAPSHRLLLVDLGVPPNVDPEASTIPGVERFGMDDVIAEVTLGRNARLNELASARIIVDDHLDRLRRDYAIREAAPALQRLGDEYQALAVESLRRLRLNGSDPEALRESLRQWAEGFARRLAHAPMKGLRTLAAEAGSSAVEAYMRGLEEALTSDLRDSKSIDRKDRT